MDFKALTRRRFQRMEEVARSRGAVKDKDMAALTGMTIGYFSNLRNGHKQFGEEKAREVEETLRLDYYYLDGILMDDPQGRAQKAYRDYRMVPVLGEASCGDFKEVYEMSHDDIEVMPAPFPCDPRSFWVVVGSESMYNPGGNRSYKIGDKVLFECDRTPEIGKSVIAMLPDGKCTMKSYQDDAGDPFLLALNPAWSPRRTDLPEGTTILAAEVAHLVI